jgi:hypothetical protein
MTFGERLWDGVVFLFAAPFKAIGRILDGDDDVYSRRRRRRRRRR